MRITKKLLAARAAFKNRVSNFVKAIGAVECDGTYRFKVDTPIGLMQISLWDSAIMCRFDDVEQATPYTRRHTSQSCNPYSGKWNWHFDDNADTLNSQCERGFVRYVTKLMSERLPHDLSKMTPVQHELCVAHLERLPERELRRRQDLTTKQIGMAFDQRNEAMLASLHVRNEHLRLAVDRKEFSS